MSALAETIAIQGRVLRHVLDLDLARAVASLEGAERVWLVGTGTSEHAACLGAAMLATAGIDARASSAASFVAAGRLDAGAPPDHVDGGAPPDRLDVGPRADRLDGRASSVTRTSTAGPRLGPDDALIVISHTTQTAFARRVREDALAAGTRLVSITAEGKDWPEAIEAAPAERSETYTASYLAALLACARLAVALGGADWTAADLAALPSLVENAGVEPLPVPTPPRRITVLFGAGPAAVTAREGALKLREAARVLAEGFEAEYLLHGSAVPLGCDDHLIAVHPGADPSGLASSLADAAERDDIPVTRLDPPPDLHPLLAQLPLTVCLQALASRWADRQDIDPDTVILGAWADPSLWTLGAPGATAR
jgi:glucosamine--fructose-6-phosphate aminotransferase (isomerizing)